MARTEIPQTPKSEREGVPWVMLWATTVPPAACWARNGYRFSGGWEGPLHEQREGRAVPVIHAGHPTRTCGDVELQHLLR